MSLHIKIIDEPTGRVVMPLEVWNWDGDRWTEPPDKQILVRIHDLDRNQWLDPTEFRDDFYVFPQRFSSHQDRRYHIYHPRYPKSPLTVSPGGIIRNIARSAPRQRVDSGSGRLEVRLTPHHLIRSRGRDRFAFGANLAWLDGFYDHDLGPNELHHYQPYLDPANAAYDSRLNNLVSYFHQMRSRFHFRIVRLWVFEGCEGLTFAGGNVQMHGTLRTNVQRILTIAAQEGILLYWCLLTSDPEHPGFAKDLEIIRSAQHPDTSPFLNQALRTFCEAIRGSSQTFAVDVMNEPEKYVRRRDVTWDQIKKYVQECCRKIKSYNGEATLVSCGSAGTGWVNTSSISDTIKNYVGLGLDFYDYHIYNDTGVLPVTYDQLHGQAQLDRPCIVGEFGQDRDGFLDELQKGVVRNFLQQAWHKGFGGCVIWNYNYRDFPHADRNTRHRRSLIYRNGSPRPVVEPLSTFATDYQTYAD